MSRAFIWPATIVAGCVLLSLLAPEADAQNPLRDSGRVRPVSFEEEYPVVPAEEVMTPIPRQTYSQPLPPVNPQLPTITRNALNYYGGAYARETLSRMPQRTPVIPNPQVSGPPTKPFESVERDPTISPYMNLYRNEGLEDAESIPNYYMFVRPQFEQQETTRRQEQEVQRLQGQMRSMTDATIGTQYGGGAGPPTARPVARFMDTGQFYSRWR